MVVGNSVFTYVALFPCTYAYVASQAAYSLVVWSRVFSSLLSALDARPASSRAKSSSSRVNPLISKMCESQYSPPTSPIIVMAMISSVLRRREEGTWSWAICRGPKGYGLSINYIGLDRSTGVAVP